MVDKDERIVCRREQFLTGSSLPTELIIRDKRFTESEIRAMCEEVGFEVIFTRFVHMGHWMDEGIKSTDKDAKEILIKCRRKTAR